jgi:hypothetical protein
MSLWVDCISGIVQTELPRCMWVTGLQKRLSEVTFPPKIDDKASEDVKSSENFLFIFNLLLSLLQPQ